MTLIADGFLAGSLLTLLLPVALLIALVIWYLMFLRRVPEPSEGGEAVAGGAANPEPVANPGAGAGSGPGAGSGYASDQPAGQRPAES